MSATDWIDNADDARWYHSQPERADVDHPGEIPSGPGETGELTDALEASRGTLAEIAAEQRLLADLRDIYTATDGADS